MKKNLEYKVENQTTLLPFLEEQMSEYPKKKIKNYLTHGSVFVDGKKVTQFDKKLAIGQTVTILSHYGGNNQNTMIDIIYEDTEFLVVNKPAGILSISSEREKEKTMYHMVRDYIKTKNKYAKVFVVHRLDQDTSGVLLFTKSEKLKQKLQENWNELVQTRKYIAVVEGILPEKNGTIHNWLTDNDSYRVYVTKNHKEGKEAITEYRVTKEKKDLSYLELNLKTGRKNQIRVHMSSIGHPVVGDKKYGAKTNPAKRLLLHALILEFVHPITHKTYQLKAPVPKELK